MSQNFSITSSAPGKLMLAGSYAVVHGRSSVVTAIDQRIAVTVEKNDTNQLLVNAPDVHVSNYTVALDKIGSKEAPKAVKFIEASLKIYIDLYGQIPGLKVTTKSDFSSTVGFGSSSAVTVAFVHALYRLFGMDLTKKQLFDLCYQAVLAVQGVGSGFDIAAAVWGGTIRYAKPAAVVEELDLTSEELFNHLVVCYSGQKADTAVLVKGINTELENEPQRISQLFDQIGQTAEEMYQSLLEKNWQQAGKHLLEHQKLASQLGVSTDKIDTLVNSATNAGAYGAGLSGAGGGDCIFAFVSTDKKQAVIKALEKEGQVIPVSFNASGVRVESSK
jgi:mevalonate kinase